MGDSRRSRSASPTILLRISDGSVHMHRSFNDFPQAERSAQAPRMDQGREAFAERDRLFAFEERHQLAVPPHGRHTALQAVP